MESLPHRYAVAVASGPLGHATASSAGLPDLAIDSPAEFGGPGGLWSPETLLMASLANCLALSWRSVAAHNRFAWDDVGVDVTGILDRVDRVTRFTEVSATVRLTVPEGTDAALAERLVLKAKSVCLISNSLNAEQSVELHLAHP